MVKLRAVTVADRATLDRLMQFYMYDFSEIVELEFDHTGVFPSGLLDRFLPDANNHAWLIESDGLLAGFVLVSCNVQLKESKIGSLIKEFFVMRSHRGSGVGRRVAHEIFKMHPGEWNVSVMQKNTRAAEFWMNTIDVFTTGQFAQRVYDDDWKGTIFSFTAQTTPAGSLPPTS